MIETFSYMFVNHSPSSKVPKFMNPKTVMHCAARIIGVPIQKMPGPRGIKKFESVTVPTNGRPGADTTLSWSRDGG